MRVILKIIDSISEWAGSSARYLALALVLLGIYDVILRYVLHASTVWVYQTTIMVGGGIYAFSWAYNRLHISHVRVDIFYTHFSLRKRALSDVICAAIFFFPLMVILMKFSVCAAWDAWVTHEVMTESFWYPPSWPFRTVIALGVCLLFLQGSAQFVRDFYFAVRGKPYD